MSVLLYGAETWTLLVADIGTLGAYHMKCQWQMLNIHWWDPITNAEVLQKTGLSTISEITVACLFSATLHARTLNSQQTRPCS